MVAPGRQARLQAASLVDGLRASDSDLLLVDGVDLAPALEQVLFATLRAGLRAPPARSAFQRWARLPLAARSLGRRRPRLGADVLVVPLADVHRRLFDPVREEIERDTPEVAIRFLAAGRARVDSRAPGFARLNDAPISWSAFRRLARMADPIRLRRATRPWRSMLGSDEAARISLAAHDALLRLGIMAARIDGAIVAAEPRLVVTYDEIDAWGRLIAAAAHHRRVPSLDLPHAEAVDIEAIRGNSYTAMAVFGQRAASVLEAAEVPSRIVQVGAARLDPLIRAADTPVDRPPRLILAAQYVGGLMTEPVSHRIFEAALAVAERLAPSVLQVVPHPTEPETRWRTIAARARVPSGVDLRVEARGTLTTLLPGAAVLITGWSNSVYEAVVAGVPALTVHTLASEPPMPFAREGISVEARSAEEAAMAAAELVSDPGRSVALRRARAALEPHLGPLDGRATRRTADLVREMAAR